MRARAAMERKDRPAGRRMVVLVVLTALVLMVIDGRGSALIDGSRRAMSTAMTPAAALVGWVGAPVGRALDGIRSDSEELRTENAELRAEIADLRGRLEQAPGDAAELAELQRATGLGTADSLPSVVARVTADLRTPTARTLEIDRGSNHGVARGQSVVTGQGLVGEIVWVDADSARIRPITDPRTTVGVRSPVSGAVGVATGEGDGKRLGLSLVERDREVVEPGEQFMTSGFERSHFPAGIPVGSFQLDVGGEVTLVPAADLERLGFVSVIVHGGQP